MRSGRMMTFAFCALLVAPLLSQDQMRPGRWEINMRFETPGSPFNSPHGFTNSRCVTTEQARTPVEAVWAVTGRVGTKRTCKVSDFRANGNTLTWKEACSDGVNHPTTGDGEIVFNGDSFTGKVNLIIPPGTVGSSMPERPNNITHYAGKRIGDCQ